MATPVMGYCRSTGDRIIILDVTVRIWMTILVNLIRRVAKIGNNAQVRRRPIARLTDLAYFRLRVSNMSYQNSGE